MPRSHPPVAPALQGDQRLRGFVGYGMKRAYALIQADATRVLEPLGLRISTYSALVVICDNKDLRQSQLAEILSIERSNTVVIIDALEEAGLIERRRVPTDRRSYALRATLPGRRLCDQATNVLEEHENRILSRIDAAERARLIALLRQIDGTTAAEAGQGGEQSDRAD